jgi:hypothetical protein
VEKPIETTQFPPYPQKRTFLNAVLMSALCQKQTHARSKRQPYSITSSAVEGNAGGTLRSSTLAVLALMLSWNLLAPIKPTVGNFLVCCARASIGHAVADPAISLMKSRRRIACPRRDYAE